MKGAEPFLKYLGVDDNLVFDHLHESLNVVLYWSTVYYAVQGGSGLDNILYYE